MSSLKFNKILYLGPWDHIDVVSYFPLTTEFVFIDILPGGQLDGMDFYEGFYNKNFIKIITDKCESFGFILKSITNLDPTFINKMNNINDDSLQLPYVNPHLFEFVNYDEQTQITRKIKFYVSTNILYNMCGQLEQDIYEANALYISGYHPDIKLLEYFNCKKKAFIGDSNTIYYLNDYCSDDYTNIIYNFHTNKLNEFEYFHSFYILYRNGESNEFINIEPCENLDELNKFCCQYRRN